MRGVSDRWMRNAPQTVQCNGQIIMVMPTMICPEEERSLPRFSPCDTPITPDRSRVPMMKTFRMREACCRREKKRKEKETRPGCTCVVWSKCRCHAGTLTRSHK